MILQLKKQRNDENEMPICVISEPVSKYDSFHYYPVKHVTKGKILADESLLDSGVAITTDDDLTRHIRECIEDLYEEDLFAKNPDEYYRRFREEAEQYKGKWKETIFITIEKPEEW